jgi:uncharacterized protein (DUF433 family)
LMCDDGSAELDRRDGESHRSTGEEAKGLGRYARITVRADQMGGVPCIRGLRIPVATVVKLLAAGCGESDILSDYPDLQPEDIREALAFAAEAVDERQLPVINPA